jgi:subfamily B ATP-binding cassette protein HlyB/CyaB
VRDVGLAKEDVLLALAAMCQIERVPFDASLVLREFPPPYSLETLLHAAGRLGFEAATREAAAEGIAAIGTPCVVLLAGVPVEGVEAPAHRLAVVTRATETELQLIEPGRAGPVTVSPEGFATRFTGLVVQFALAGKPVADPDARAEAAPAFGFRWFVPELLKHKPIWRDVLAASAAIQLLALATPLFTQVVIDKVVVHQTVNTLVVIGVALVVSLFSAAELGAAVPCLHRQPGRHSAPRARLRASRRAARPLLRTPASQHDRRTVHGVGRSASSSAVLR